LARWHPSAGNGAGSTEKVFYNLTDPSYTDAVNYEELSEFFLAW